VLIVKIPTEYYIKHHRLVYYTLRTDSDSSFPLQTMPRQAKSYELAPVEIWNHIITFAIDGALLLSNSPFEGDWQSSSMTSDWICPMYTFDNQGTIYWGMHDKPAMQQFRQIRATLRRVSRSWKRFVDSPYIEHRCMRFCIPSHADEEPDPARVVVARRIEVLSSPGASQHFEGVLGNAIKRGCVFDAEILLDIGGTLVPRIFPSHLSSFPFLTTLLIDYRHHHTVIPLPDDQPEISLPYISSLTTLILRLGDNQEIPDQRILRLPNLRSLSMSSRYKLPHLDFSKWRVPFLRHLELVGLSDVVISLKSV